ncbi:hypothetical protein EVAR_54919_1 [Eumeta japonica]|uniref:Uncharacterized protein n=1 Tax=Eumeta variegata TaxID=151549 RepID=A0A4C1YAT9_EUMVA|nr:hypothetical protein EVAR_54919_1 [Eumeta japonica]
MIYCAGITLPGPSFFSATFLLYAIATILRRTSQRQSFVRFTARVKGCAASPAGRLKRALKATTCVRRLQMDGSTCSYPTYELSKHALRRRNAMKPGETTCRPGADDKWPVFILVVSAPPALHHLGIPQIACITQNAAL